MATLAALSGAAQRPALVLATTSLAMGSIALAVISRSTAAPLPATTSLVLVATAAAGAVLLRATNGLSRKGGWASLRRLLTAITLVAVAYPGIFATAAIASTHAPHTPLAWALAVLAGVAHLPLIAAFSLVPLLTVRYLGRGSGRTGLAVVTTLGAGAVGSFVLFFGDFEPLAAAALVQSDLGERIGMGLNLAFLTTVLLGPVAAIVATWRSDATAARRLALVSGSSLAGTALVMVCGAVGSDSPLGQGLLLIGMYAALALVVTGCTAALSVDVDRDISVDVDMDVDMDADVDADVEPAFARPGHGDHSTPEETPVPARVGTLTPREREVLQLLAEGLSNAGIAARLVLSERTVDAHLRSVFTKLDLPQSPEHNRRVHAVNAWQRAVDPPEGATRHVEQRS